MTVPFGTDIVCGCSILLFGCKLFGTTLFLLSVNGLGLAAPTLTVRLCLLWSIWLDSTPAGRKNSKFNTRSAVQCPRIFFLFCFIFIHFLFRESTFRPHERSLCERSPWRLKAPSTRNRVKPSEKPSETEFCGFKSSGEPRPSDKGEGGEGGSSIKKKIFSGPSGLRKNKGGGPLPWIHH